MVGIECLKLPLAQVQLMLGLGPEGVHPGLLGHARPPRLCQGWGGCLLYLGTEGLWVFWAARAGQADRARVAATATAVAVDGKAIV